jgi:putative flippase GtrA
MTRSTSTHFLLFAAIGALGTMAHYVLMVVMVQGLGYGTVISAQTGAALGALVNYVLNRRLNYRETRAHRHVAPRFVLVVCTGFVLNGLVVAGLTGLAGWHYLAAQLGATAVVLGWGFVGNHFWTFSKEQA